LVNVDVGKDNGRGWCYGTRRGHDLRLKFLLPGARVSHKLSGKGLTRRNKACRKTLEALE
jgi:hypothetical protein